MSGGGDEISADESGEAADGADAPDAGAQGELTGHLLADRYRLGTLLGAGGMGEVWQAEDDRLHRAVAVKVFAPQRGIPETERVELLSRFEQEARAVARLDSPHIVAVHDHGAEPMRPGGPDTPYLVMSLVRGRTLQDVLAEPGRIPVARALTWAEQVCRALETAHAAGIVHRDIKPANVMVEGNPDEASDNAGTGTGTTRPIKVLDFGIARFVEATAVNPRLTRTGEMPFGSVLYLAPERFQEEAGDSRTDLYALGCVLYELLTGRPPFTGGPAMVMRGHLDEAPLRPSRRRREIPEAVDRVVLALLAKTPDARPASAAAAAELLHAVRTAPAALPAFAELPELPDLLQPADEPEQFTTPPEDARPPSLRPEDAVPAPDEPPLLDTRRRERITWARRGAAAALALGLAALGLNVATDRLGTSGDRSADSAGAVIKGERPGAFTIGITGFDGGTAIVNRAIAEARRKGVLKFPVNSRRVETNWRDRSPDLRLYPGVVALIGKFEEVRITESSRRYDLAFIETSSREAAGPEARAPLGLRTVAGAFEQVEQLGRYLTGTLRAKRVYVQRTSPQAPRADRLTEVLSNAGAEVIARRGSTKQSKQEFVNDVRASGADAVYLEDAGDARSLAEALTRSGYRKPSVLGPNEGNQAAEDAVVSTLAEGWLRMRPTYAPTTVAPALDAKPEEVARRTEVNHVLGPWAKRDGAAELFDAATAVLTALARTARDDTPSVARRTVAENLRRTEANGLLGRIPVRPEVIPADPNVWLDTWQLVRGYQGRWRELGTITDLISSGSDCEGCPPRGTL